MKVVPGGLPVQLRVSLAPEGWSIVQSFTAELVDRDLLVRVGSGSKVHVFRTHPRLQPVTDRLNDGGAVKAVALCGSKGEMSLADDGDVIDEDDACGTCARMLEETARRRRPRGRSAAS